MKLKMNKFGPYSLLLIGALGINGCASNPVTEEAFLSLQAQVDQMEKRQSAMLQHINERHGYDRNALIMAFKMHDHLAQLKQKLCGVRFVVTSRTIQMTPENGYPIPDECLVTPVLTTDELDFMGSYLTVSENE